MGEMAQQQRKPVEVVMRGGTGEGSYYRLARAVHGDVDEFYWPQLWKAIEDSKLQLLPGCCNIGGANVIKSSIAIADFGCSCGWSTVGAMAYTAACLRRLYAAQHSPGQVTHLPIQAFFADFPSNDFNTLFTLLSDASSSQQKDHTILHPLDFFPAGVPGSFYTRLFPPAHLHVALSTLALHYLSEVPKAVQDKNSVAWNEGGIWMMEGCKLETAQEYAMQFQRDFGHFLRLRNEELVVGGLLFCVILASKERYKLTNNLAPHRNLELAWKELIAEGLLDKASIDNFNLPLFMPSVEDVQEAVEACGVLKILELGLVEVPWMDDESVEWGKLCAIKARNYTGAAVEAHLGKDKFELLMKRVESVAVATENTSSHFATLIVLALQPDQQA